MPDSISSSNNKDLKLKTALLSVFASLFLITVKLIFGFFTNSISILTSAVDSLLDLTASTVNYFSIRKSDKPADTDHKYGHGKVEGLAGLFQSLLIFLSSLYLIYISGKRIIYGGELSSLDYGILIMALSVVISFFVARHINRVAEETESLALKADSYHFRFDVYTNLGVIIGLIAIRLTGLTFIDSIVSIIIAVLIIWSTLEILKKSIDVLMDRELPDHIVKKVEGVIEKYKPTVKSYHKLRTRSAGAKKFIEFHLVIDHTLSFVESHELAEVIVKDIESTIPASEVTVHVDPDTITIKTQ